MNRGERVVVGLCAAVVLAAGLLLRQHVADQLPGNCLRMIVCPDCPFYARGALHAAEGHPPGVGPLYSTWLAVLGAGPGMLTRNVVSNGLALAIAPVLAGLCAAQVSGGRIGRGAAVLGAGAVAMGTTPMLDLQLWLRPDALGAMLMALAGLAAAWTAARPGSGRALAWGLALGLLSTVREHGFAIAAAAVPAVTLMGSMKAGPALRRGLALASGWLLVGALPLVGWMWSSPDDHLSMWGKVLMPVQHALGALGGGLEAGNHPEWGAAMNQETVHTRDLAALTWENLGTARALAVLALASPILMLARSRAAALAAAATIAPLPLAFAMKTLPHHLLAMVPVFAGVGVGAVGAVAAALGARADRVGGPVAPVATPLLGLAPAAAAALLLAVPVRGSGREQGYRQVLATQAFNEQLSCRQVESDALLAEALREHYPPGTSVYGEQVRYAIPVAVAGLRWGGEYPSAWDLSGTLPEGALVVVHEEVPAGWTVALELPDGSEVLEVPRGLGMRRKRDIDAPPPPGP